MQRICLRIPKLLIIGHEKLILTIRPTNTGNLNKNIIDIRMHETARTFSVRSKLIKMKNKIAKKEFILSKLSFNLVVYQVA